MYKSSSVNIQKLSYPISATVGENLTLKCPYLSDFNNTDGRIEWDKVRGKQYIFWLLICPLLLHFKLCDFNKRLHRIQYILNQNLVTKSHFCLLLSPEKALFKPVSSTNQLVSRIVNICFIALYNVYNFLPAS